MKLAFAFLALSITALAQRGGTADRWEFFAERYDKNDDASITKSEYQRSAETFARLDTNKDGKLTKADFGGASTRGRRGRGTRTRGNAPQMRGRLLARGFDRDRSGEITAEEWAKFLEFVPTEGKVSEESFKKFGITSRTTGRLLTLFDADKNGEVSRSEIVALHGNIDGDGDGVLSKKELTTRAGAPRRGDSAPDFDLPTLADTKKSVKLSSFAGKRPVALIFGSYT